ncbi:hypothetical protein L1887_14891 [Cichorium endivia]|nr:hypothetical protein L1887_14891 [Cichorium endivia]
MGSYEDLKHVGFVKLIEVKALVILSNIYDFFKDNSRCLKKTVVSVEAKVISTMRPVNEKLTIICESTLGFLDDKFEKYAPTFIKSLVGILNSCIKEKISFVEKVFGPLAHKTRTLIEKGLSTIESLLQKCIDFKKSEFKRLVHTAESILEKGLDFAEQALVKTKVVVGGVSIIGDATQSIITIHIDMVIQLIESTSSSIKQYGIFGAVTSVVEHVVKETQAKSASIVQKVFESVSHTLDTTKSVVGGIPIVGDALQSIITKQSYMVSQIFETTMSSIKENGIFGTIIVVTQNVVQEAHVTGSSIIQIGFESISQAVDTTKSVVGGIPFLGDRAQSMITKQTDMISHLIDTTTSSIKENGIFGVITSVTETVVKKGQQTSTSIIQKGSESLSQALDKTKLVVGGIPIIGDTAQSIVTKHTDMVSQLIETTTSSIKEKGIFGSITSATDNVLKKAQERGTSIIQKGSESVSQIVDTTKSAIGGIPIIGDTAQSIITKQTNMVSQMIETTTSSITENGIFGAITSIAENVVKKAKETSTSIIQKGSESISQALDTTKSVVGRIPIIGNTTQSIITKQTEMVSQLVETTTSSINENGIFGAITSSTENLMKQAQETGTSIIQRGSASISQALDTTKSVVGGIPIIGDTTQSIISKQVDMTSKLIDTTTSSIKENGLFGALISATEHVVKEAQEVSTSIIQKGFESVDQVRDTTKSIIGGIPIIGDTTQSIITTQRDMASQLIETSTSSIRENGIFGAITSATKHVVSKAQETSTSIIQKGSESISQALDTTKSVVGGIPIIGDTTQSIISKQADMTSKLIGTTTSSIKENGLFGALISATEHVVKETQEVTTSIIQKGFESVDQLRDTTKSIIGGIPIIGDTTQSIITTQRDMASQLIETSTSSIRENGIFGAITSATKHVVSKAQETSTSIIQKGSESISQALDTTKSVVGGIPIIGDTTQSIISKQADMTSKLIGTTTSSIKENGLFGALISATEHVVKEAQEVSTSIIQRSFESVDQVRDKTKSIIGGIPIIGDTTQSIITTQRDMTSQLIETSTSSIRENGIFGAITSATKHVVSKAQETSTSIIQKGSESISQALDTTKSVVGGIPIIGDTTQSIISKQADMTSKLIGTTTSSIKENGLFGALISATEHVVKEAQEVSTSIIQRSFESVDQVRDKTKSIIGGIPIIGDTTQSIITTQRDMASQLIETSTSSIRENGIFGAITSATKHVVSKAQETSTSIIQKGSESISQALDTTKSVVGGIPIIGDTTKSIINKQTDVTSQLIDTTTSSIKENGLFGALISATKDIVHEAQAVSTSVIQKGFESTSQALDTTKSVIGGIAIIGDRSQSIITTQRDMASQLIETSTSSIRENGIFGAITSATEHVVNKAQETSTSIIQKGSESISQALNTTKSVVGGIPIIGNTTQSIINRQTDMTSQVIDTTTSSIKENGIFGALISATEHVVKEAQETSTSIIQKGFSSASQAVETTKSVMGGIPIIGDTTQSIITKQTDMASKLIETTTSSIKENGIFGAITSATEHVVKEAQDRSTFVIHKGSESTVQALDTTKLVVGSIPIIGDAAQSIITKQTNMASQLINTTTSLVKENGIFGAISTATNHVVKEAHSTSESIIQKSYDSANQAIESTKSVVGGIPIIGSAAQSIITKQTDMASKVVEKSTSSVKKHGLLGAIVSVAENVVKDAEKTTKTIIQKGSNSVNKTLHESKSTVTSIPIVGNMAESILEKQTHITKKLFSF